MDGVSGIFAVISLAIQVLDTVHKTSGFVKDIQDAPRELIELSETLEQLELVLQEVNLLLQQRYMVLRLPGSPIVLFRALEACGKRIMPLQDIIQKARETMGQGRRAQRTWASFKLVAKKERLRELQTCLRDAKFDLSTAMSVNSSQVQMYHLEVTLDTSRKVIESIDRQPRVETSSTATGLEHSQPLQSHRKVHEQSEYSVIQKKVIARYQGIFGAARIDTETKSSATLHGFQATIQDIQLKVTSIVVTPKSLQRRFEIFINNHFGQIPRTLSVYPVVSWKSSFFQMCRRGDILGVQAALSEGGMTPFVLDEHGFTSLHWAAQSASPKLCSSLLRMGLDPDRRSDYGRKAVEGLGASPNSVGNGRIKAFDDGQLLGTDALVDTFRIIGQAQKEISALDVQNLWCLFGGPVQDVDMLYQLSFDLMVSEEDSQLICSGALSKALTEFGRGRMEWEYLIRKMIRKGVDLHGRIFSADIDEPDERYVGDSVEEEFQLMRKGRQSMHGTPLDNLFLKTLSPYEAEFAADGWLSILRAEGIDDVAYLEEEFTLHTAKQQLTYSGESGTTRRQLVFNFGPTPTVWWEWLLDPESGAYLVREEFKGMYTLWDDHEDLGSLAEPERDVSPFDFPDWSFERMPTGEERRENLPSDYVYRRLFAEERLDRRWKKKASKLARARRTKGPRKVPGAWPT